MVAILFAFLSTIVMNQNVLIKIPSVLPGVSPTSMYVKDKPEINSQNICMGLIPLATQDNWVLFDVVDPCDYWPYNC